MRRQAMESEPQSERLDVTDAERAMAADVAWPLTCTTIFLGLFALWYLRLLDIPFAPIALALTAAIGVQFGAFWILEGAGRPGALPLAITVVHLVGVGVLGLTWVLIGGNGSTAFLLFFAAPVAAAAIALRGWVRLFNVVATIAMIALLALLQQPSVKWSLARRGLSTAWLDFLSFGGGAVADGAQREPEAAIAIVLIGAAALSCIAIFAARMAGTAGRLQERLRRTVWALRERHGRSLDALSASPFAEALVLPDSGQVVFANARFRALQLSYPDLLQARVAAGVDGSVECSFRDQHGMLHTAIAHIRHAAHDGGRVARISLEDRSELRRLVVATDCLTDLLILIDPAERIAYLNAATLRFFPEARLEGPAAALNRPDLPDGWWRTAPATTVPRNLELPGERLVGTVSHRPAAANAEALIVIALRRNSTP